MIILTIITIILKLKKKIAMTLIMLKRKNKKNGPPVPGIEPGPRG